MKKGVLNSGLKTKAHRNRNINGHIYLIFILHIYFYILILICIHIYIIYYGFGPKGGCMGKTPQSYTEGERGPAPIPMWVGAVGA